MKKEQENINKKKNFLVEKSNPILEAKNEMNLQELRIFNIYLAYIDPNKESTKTVKIPLQTLAQLLDVELNELYMKKVAEGLKILYVNLCDFDKENKIKGAMKLRSIFDIINVLPDETGTWYLTMEAHRDILPYLFGIKEMGYLKYSLWNILRLTGAVQMKLYEVLKLGENMQNYQITLDNLKNRLGLMDSETYKKYAFLKRDVLNRCIKEINEKTDIEAEFEEIRGTGRGRPVKAIRFIVRKNKNFYNPLFVYEQNEDNESVIEILSEEKMIESAYYSVLPESVYKNKSFEIKALEKMLNDAFPNMTLEEQKNVLKIISSRYMQIVVAGETAIKNHAKYYLGILGKYIEENLKENIKESTNIHKTKFHNFEERNTDYNAILKQLKRSEFNSITST